MTDVISTFLPVGRSFRVTYSMQPSQSMPYVGSANALGTGRPTCGACDRKDGLKRHRLHPCPFRLAHHAATVRNGHSGSLWLMEGSQGGIS
jgi:hypothetical protein